MNCGTLSSRKLDEFSIPFSWKLRDTSVGKISILPERSGHPRFIKRYCKSFSWILDVGKSATTWNNASASFRLTGSKIIQRKMQTLALLEKC